jgi:hypothetical protein
MRNKKNIVTLIHLNADLSAGKDNLNRRPIQMLRDDGLLDLLTNAGEVLQVGSK